MILQVDEEALIRVLSRQVNQALSYGGGFIEADEIRAALNKMARQALTEAIAEPDFPARIKAAFIRGAEEAAANKGRAYARKLNLEGA